MLCDGKVGDDRLKHTVVKHFSVVRAFGISRCRRECGYETVSLVLLLLRKPGWGTVKYELLSRALCYCI